MTEIATQITELGRMVAGAETVLILQPDSPDGDSHGSALGLEEILGDLGKQTIMFSYKEPEPYLRVHEGWDRITQTFPKRFDLTILVDTGSPTLIKATLAHNAADLMAKPMIVIDHHTSRQDFGFKTIDVVTEAVATAELITQLAIDLGWTINERAAAKLAAAVLSDSLGLTSSGTSAHSVEMLAVLVRNGANLNDLYRLHRTTSALSPDQIHLKGRLLSSVEFLCDGRLAVAEITPDIVSANHDQFETYNMIISEMQWAKDVELVAVFKNYGAKVNVPMRSSAGLAGPIAELLGGGGHPNAAAYRCATADIEAEKQRLVEAFLSYTQGVDDAAL